MAEHGALVLAVDLFEEAALQAAVGDVAEEHLPRVRALLDHDRGARRVADLVLRDPQHRLGHRLVLEPAGRGEVVVEEAVLLDLDQLGRGQPAALVVHDEQTTAGAPAHAVGGAQAAGDVRDLAGVAVDLEARAGVGARLRVRGRAAVVDGDRAAHVHVVVVVEQAEGELVEVAAGGPRGDPALLQVPVAVGVGGELAQLVLLGDVDRAVVDRHAHRGHEVGGDLRVGDVLGAVRADDAVDGEQLARGGDVGRAGGADRARGEHEHGVGVEPGQAGHHRLEAVGAQAGEVVAGVDRVQAQAVPGGVGGALAVLGARGHDADDPGLGAQRAARDDDEGVRPGGAPLQGELLPAAGLEEVDDQVVRALLQGDRRLDRGRGVQAVVVHQRGAVQRQPGAVVAGQPEHVLAGGRRGEGGGDLTEEVVLLSELLGRGEVHRRHELVDVGGGPLLDRAQRGQGAGAVGAQRHARLLGRGERGRPGDGEQEPGGEGGAEGRRQGAPAGWVVRGHQSSVDGRGRLRPGRSLVVEAPAREPPRGGATLRHSFDACQAFLCKLPAQVVGG